MNKLIICDLDGTLCDDRHRKYLVWAGDWRSYFEASFLDGVNKSVQDFIAYCKVYKNCDIAFLTGRPEIYREKTEFWLKNTLINIPYSLFMRQENDYRSAEVYKREITEILIKENGLDNIFAAIDDNEKCIEMFKVLGIRKTILYRN